MEGNTKILHFDGPGAIEIIIHVLTIATSLAIVILSIYCLILIIKLAHRGIKALDIYIKNNSHAI